MKPLLSTLLFAFSVTLSAQGLDKGKPIVDKALAALGGDSFLHMQTRTESGRVYSFFHEQISGFDIANIYTQYADTKPQKGLGVTERQVFGKKQDYSVLFLPDQGWDITFRGARPMADENWEKYVRTTESNFFYFLRERYAEPGFQYDYVGNDVLLNAQVEIVDIIDPAGKTIRVYFDHITMLPVRQVYSWIDPDTKYRNEEVSDYSKYREFDGIKWPMVIHRERNGYKIFEIFADRVEINRALPQKTFELPRGVKVLKKTE